jgi:hypothetical protein
MAYNVSTFSLSFFKMFLNVITNTKFHARLISILLYFPRSSNALTGVGVNEGIEWLCGNIAGAKRK